MIMKKITGGKEMAISKWDLFKKIEEVPKEKYSEIQEYLDRLLEKEKVILDEKSKKDFKKSLNEYSEGDYLTFDQVFEKGDNDI